MSTAQFLPLRAPWSIEGCGHVNKQTVPQKDRGRYRNSIRGGGHGNIVASFLTELGEKGALAKQLEGVIHGDGNHRKDRNSPLH